jgi:hypothetical protein
MSEWQGIENAPTDGSMAWVKRVYQGHVIAEGWAVFDVPDQRAPMLQPIGPDPLGRPVNTEVEMTGIEAARVAKRWLHPDRLYAFPTPTHYRPALLATLA